MGAVGSGIELNARPTDISLGVEYVLKMLKDQDARSIHNFLIWLTGSTSSGNGTKPRFTAVPTRELAMVDTVRRFNPSTTMSQMAVPQETIPVPREAQAFDLYLHCSSIVPNVGRLVTANSSGGLGFSQASGVDDHKETVGVVQERVGNYARVRVQGRTQVQIDTVDWPDARYNEIWYSTVADGVASGSMPRTARKGITLIGRKIGETRNGMVDAYIHPPVYPVNWIRIWEHDANCYIDLEYIALWGGCWRIVFVIDGETVAMLDETRFSLAGHFQELPYAVAQLIPALDSRVGEIEYSQAQISFNTQRWGSTVNSRVAVLTPAGDFRVAAVRETGSLVSVSDSAIFDYHYYKWDDVKECLDISLDRQRTAFRLARFPVAGINNARLEIKEIREDAW